MSIDKTMGTRRRPLSTMDNREKHRPIASDLRFVVVTAIAAIALILLSIAFGVSIDPDASIFSSP